MWPAALFLGLAAASLGEPGEQCGESCQVNFLQVEVARVGRSPAQAAQGAPWYPSRAVDHNRSGLSPALGPWPLKEPAWLYEVPGLNFHQTPCIDHQENVYTGSDNGKILSFDRQGNKRWEYDGPARSCQNPFLFEGVLYTACSDGSVLALTMEKGQLLWSRKVADAEGGDTYSITATRDHLFMPAGIAPKFGMGAPKVVLLRRADGEMLWEYELPNSSATINIAPCLLESSVVFADVSGAMYRLRLEDGSVMWQTPPPVGGTFTLGGVACDAEGHAFSGVSLDDHGPGALQSIDLETGTRLWLKTFVAAVHNAPAIGPVFNHDKVAVVFGAGEPLGVPVGPAATVNGTVIAADAKTGEVIWTFEPPPYTGYVAGSTITQVCLPDLFSGATISADGTVYINWSAGGVTYALRDANKDGRVDLHDPKEVSSVDLGSGATGPPALAPGMLFVNSCRRLAAIL